MKSHLSKAEQQRVLTTLADRKNAPIREREAKDRDAMLEAFLYIHTHCEDENGRVHMPDLPGYVEYRSDGDAPRCSEACSKALHALRSRIVKRL